MGCVSKSSHVFPKEPFIYDDPDFSILPAPWAKYGGTYSVGEVICEPWEDEDLELNSRFLARTQLRRLRDLGYAFMSTYEIIHHQPDALKSGPFQGLQPSHELSALELHQHMVKSKIDVMAMSIDSKPSYLELNLQPTVGIDSADQAFRCKQAFIDYFKIPNFILKSDTGENTLPMSFSHSLLHYADFESAFNQSQAPDKMSDIARHWIGGLQKHARALTALLRSAPDCYQPSLKFPKLSSWGKESNLHPFTVVFDCNGAPSVVNNLACKASDPYLLMACTIAAGLDGVCQEIEPVSSMDKLDKLPASLPEAMDALQNDHVLIEALGEKFIQMFCAAHGDFSV